MSGELGRVRRIDGREAVRDAVRADRLIALVADVPARATLLFDVGHIPVSGHLAVSAGHTPTRECREPEQSDETHQFLELVAMQISFPSAPTARRDASTQKTSKTTPDLYRSSQKVASRQTGVSLRGVVVG
jgi:hypothetical protein